MPFAKRRLKKEAGYYHPDETERYIAAFSYCLEILAQNLNEFPHRQNYKAGAHPRNNQQNSLSGSGKLVLII